MSEYQEFTGKTVEEALREARSSFGVASLDDLDFEILTPGSRGVLGMGAEPARIIAAPRSALGGAAPRREAAAATPLPAAERPAREDDRRGRGGFERRDRGGDRGASGGRGERDRGPRRERPDRAGFERRDRPERPAYTDRPRGDRPERGPRPDRSERPERTDRSAREDREPGGRSVGLSESEQAEVRASRASMAVEREEIQAAEASPEALEAGKVILGELLGHMGLRATVSVQAGETSKLNVTGDDDDREALGALIGRKGERLSALQHLVNLMLSRKMGEWTRVLVDVEDYRGRRERQLRDLSMRAAQRVVETGKMLQLEPMPALERRWIHLALRNHPDVLTQSIGEEPQRRVVILRRNGGN